MDSGKTFLGKDYFVLRLALSRRVFWILVLSFLVMASCKPYKPWLHIDRIDTEGFDSVRSAISPDMERLFEIAEQEFVAGAYWYEYRADIDMQSAYERYGVSGLHIVQFEASRGSAYQVLFVYTLHSRTAAGGYYYTPAGKMPSAAPIYGVVCSKHLVGDWYAFNTVDSRTPPNARNCPEDTQYQ